MQRSPEPSKTAVSVGAAAVALVPAGAAARPGLASRGDVNSWNG